MIFMMASAEEEAAFIDRVASEVIEKIRPLLKPEEDTIIKLKDAVKIFNRNRDELAKIVAELPGWSKGSGTSPWRGPKSELAAAIKRI